MGIKTYKPTSVGRRHGSVLDYSEITRTTPEKSLLRPMRKSGGRFDLAIALGILAASRQLPAESFAGNEFYGELALDGELAELSFAGVGPGGVHLIVDCVKFNKKLVPVGEYIPQKRNLARFVIEE